MHSTVLANCVVMRCSECSYSLYILHSIPLTLALAGCHFIALSCKLRTARLCVATPRTSRAVAHRVAAGQTLCA